MHTLPQITDSIWEFFFAEISVVPLGVLRILVGLLILVDLASLWPDRHIWIGNRGPFKHAQWARSTGQRRFSLFRYFGSDRATVDAMCIAQAMLAFSVVIGVGTTVVVPLLFFSLISIHHRNTFVLYGGDAILRLLLFFLCFAPTGSVLSVDQWFIGQNLGLHEVAPAWPLRLVQLQMSVVYLYAYLHKEASGGWPSGLSIWYVVRNEAFMRGRIPRVLMGVWACRILTWGTLGLQFALGTLIWIEEFTLVLVAIGICFHLVLAYCLAIHLFSWIAIVGLTSFVPPEVYLGGWVTGSGGLAMPQSWELVVIGLCVSIIVLWDIPIATSIRTAFVRATWRPMLWLGLQHQWAMFTGKAPGKTWIDLRIVTQTADGECSEYAWDSTGFRLAADMFQFGCNHRSRKFIDALLKQRPLADEFLGYTFDMLGRSVATRIVALGIVRIHYSTPDPDGVGPIAPERTAVTTKHFEPGLVGSQLAITLARAAFAWRLCAGGPALAEAAEIVLLIGVTMRRLGRSDATALGRLKELVALGARLEPRRCDAFDGLAATYLSPDEYQVYHVLLSDLRDGHFCQLGTHPALMKVMPVNPAEAWPELARSVRAEMAKSNEMRSEGPLQSGQNID